MRYLFASLLAVSIVTAPLHTVAQENGGTLSGTIDFRTYAKAGADRIPPGATVTIAIAATKPSHPMVIKTLIFNVSDSPTTTFRITGLPLQPLQIEATTFPGAFPNSSYSWTVTFRPLGEGLSDDGGFTLTEAAPTQRVALTLQGVSTPADLPAHPAPSSMYGKVDGRIELDGTGVPDVDPSRLWIDATVAGSHRSVLGLSSSFGPVLRNPDGTHFIQFELTELPLNVPLTISVDPNSHPAHQFWDGRPIHFRAKDGTIGDDTIPVKLDVDHPTFPKIIDFVPYELEAAPDPGASSAERAR